MNINIVCVGKIKEGFYTQAINEYLKRLSRFAKVNVIEVAECLQVGSSLSDINIVKTTESNKVIEKLKGYVIALDLSGENISSEGLATLIKDKCVDGFSDFTFLIGGSFGMTNELLSKAHKKIAFGKITFPHQLMRVVLCEQIYRAFMINEGSPYHK